VIEEEQEGDDEICRFANALTLGNVQGDQSEVILRKESVFYTN
jgi:hypothetical protein